MATFAEAVTVEPTGPGRWRAELDDGWNLLTVPQGGVVVALALRAAEAALSSPEQTLRTCTTVFAGQVGAGPIEIEVELLRRGRSASQLVATARNAGAGAGATVTAVYGSPRPGPTFVDVRPPTVPGPEECPGFGDNVPAGVEPMVPMPFWTKVEGRAALGHPPWEEHEPGPSDTAAWYRFVDPPRRPDGSLDPLALVAIADRMPGCISEALGHRGPRFFAPSADLTVHLFEPMCTEWVLAHDRARWADDGWASAESYLWSEDGTLVAYATQMMLFTYTGS